MPDDLSRPDDGPSLSYADVIDIDGLRVPLVDGIVTDAILKPLKSGRYEKGERVFLAELLRPDDRVLDLGGGLGLVSATAARLVPEGQVLTVEAQPNLLPLIRETWALNGVTNARLRHGLIAPEGGAGGTFYIRRDFWASSFEPDSRPYVAKAEVPQISLADLIAEFRPTVICCDIEGAEEGLFDRADLSGVRAVILETHPKVYGEAARDGILSALASGGLAARDQDKPSTVYVCERRAAPAATPAPERWPPTAPRVLVATCMKDEGPFILEWLAWHKAIGVTDVVVFSNDCTDGTDALLDRLDALGELTHLPNPASAIGSTYFQPAALEFVQKMPVFRQADFFISMDVDEFVSIHTGDGTLVALFAAVPAFDVLSMFELNHGWNGREHFAPGWITEQFPAHGNLRPGRWKARVGVKSITRPGPAIAAIRNHRPDLTDPKGASTVWIDGSGQPLADLARDPTENGADCRGRRDLVTLDHFPLRSLDSFLVKRARGDVVVAGKSPSHTYWRRRNQNTSTENDLALGIARARAWHRRYEADSDLMALHRSCVAAHAAKIAELADDPEAQALRRRLLEISAEQAGQQTDPPPAKGTGGEPGRD
jgi:FkbM family methyltransferase